MEEARMILRALKDIKQRFSALEKLGLDAVQGDEEGAAMSRLVYAYIRQETVTRILQIFHPGASYVDERIAEVMPIIKQLFGA